RRSLRGAGRRRAGTPRALEESVRLASSPTAGDTTMKFTTILAALACATALSTASVASAQDEGLPPPATVNRPDPQTLREGLDRAGEDLQKAGDKANKDTADAVDAASKDWSDAKAAAKDDWNA